MVFAPVNLPSKSWRVASALALLALSPAVSLAQEAAPRSVLVIHRVSGHWLGAALEDVLAQALPGALREAGFEVKEYDPFASVFPDWVSRLLPRERDESSSIGDGDHRLAVASGADVYLRAELAEQGSDVALRAQLTGTASRRDLSLEVAEPASGDAEKLGWTLARLLAAALTEDIWRQIGANPEGRCAAAAEQFAAGEAARDEGRLWDAALAFAVAAAADPTNADYLSAAADAYAAVGGYPGALALTLRLLQLRPDDRTLRLRAGDLALLAGDRVAAQFLFQKAADADPSDLRAVEGLARVARADGDAERAQLLYQQVIRGLPDLPGAPWLAALLAKQPDDAIQLTTVPRDQIGLPLGRLYLRGGYFPEGVQSLLSYHLSGDRPAYADAGYLALAAGLDEEADRVARAVADLAERPPDQLADDRADAELADLHSRSDRLATLAERMQVSPQLDPAHRYRVLAYNLLNQSNFEALLYHRTHDQDRGRRADLLRDACRKARSQAQELEQGLLGAPR